MTVSLNGFHMRSQSHFDDKEVFDVCVGRLRVLEVLQYCDVSFLLSPPSGYPFATRTFAETRMYTILDSHNTDTHANSSAPLFCILSVSLAPLTCGSEE